MMFIITFNLFLAVRSHICSNHIYSDKYNITTDYDVYNHIQLIPSYTKSYLSFM
jgi:hypothetical protein